MLNLVERDENVIKYKQASTTFSTNDYKIIHNMPSCQSKEGYSGNDSDWGLVGVS